MLDLPFADAFDERSFVHPELYEMAGNKTLRQAIEQAEEGALLKMLALALANNARVLGNSALGTRFYDLYGQVVKSPASLDTWREYMRVIDLEIATCKEADPDSDPTESLRNQYVASDEWHAAIHAGMREALLALLEELDAQAKS